MTFYTIADLAKHSGKSASTIRKMIERKLLPESNYRLPKTTIQKGDRAGEEVLGARIYSSAVFTDIVKWLKKVKRGKKVSEALALEIRLVMRTEKEKLSNQQ